MATLPGRSRKRKGKKKKKDNKKRIDKKTSRRRKSKQNNRELTEEKNDEYIWRGKRKSRKKERGGQGVGWVGVQGGGGGEEAEVMPPSGGNKRKVVITVTGATRPRVGPGPPVAAAGEVWCWGAGLWGPTPPAGSATDAQRVMLRLSEGVQLVSEGYSCGYQ